MRRTLFIIAALLALLPLSAQQTQDALYIYRNDGGFNGFFFDDIEKIEFSRTDTLGIEHQDYVVQEVYALDSIFRIPISAIDSVCFVTPETKYKEDVKATNESELWSYVIGSDSVKTLLLSPSIPASILPSVGDKLVSTDSRDYLPGGFYGKVLNISNGAKGITVNCQQADLTELFDQYVCKVAAEGEMVDADSESVRSRRACSQESGTLDMTIPVHLQHYGFDDLVEAGASIGNGTVTGSGFIDVNLR